MCEVYRKYQNALKVLFDQYVWIKNIRNIYKELFENETNSRLLEISANSFFATINTMMINQLTLSYCKITDPFNKREKNLTLGYFLTMELSDTDRKDLELLYKEILNFRQKILKARNKIVGHNDLYVITRRQKLGRFKKGEDFIFQINIEDYLNRVNHILNGKIFGEIHLGIKGDVFDLLKYLKRGIFQ